MKIFPYYKSHVNEMKLFSVILTGTREVISGSFVDDDANDALMVAEFQVNLKYFTIY